MGQWKLSLKEQMRNNQTSRHMGTRDLNYSMFSGMNERERKINKAELEQMYSAYKEGKFELP